MTLLTDSGVENVNDTVDGFLCGGILKRVLAQVEIVGSSSLIESWWRSLKHSWLFINSLDSQAAVDRLVSFLRHSPSLQRIFRVSALRGSGETAFRVAGT